jgi:pimeloyl-ACP methyl ester carboxylesterase
MNPKQQSSLGALQFKSIDGLQIRFAANDRKSGDAILLLSPLPESILAFLPTWDSFSSLGPVIAMDLPAFGLSESRAGVRSPEGLASTAFPVSGFGVDFFNADDRQPL